MIETKHTAEDPLNDEQPKVDEFKDEQPEESKSKPKKTKSAPKNPRTKTIPGSDKRSFALYENGKKTGRYIAKSPYQSALKAFNKLGKEKAQFSIIETTQGSNHKVFTYNGERINAPSEVKLKNGQTIKYKYRTKIKAVKKAKTD